MAATFDDHALRAGPSFSYHIFSSSDEVVEHVEFLHLCAGFVPCLAIFRAAAEIGLRIDAAIVEPYQSVGRERGCERDVEAAVAVEVYGVCAIFFQPFAVGEEHGHAGAVGRWVEYLLSDIVVGVEAFDLGTEIKIGFARREIVAVDGAGIQERCEGVERVGIVARE